MRAFHRVMTFVLAALWLPAVCHCGVESLQPVDVESACCSQDPNTSAPTAGVCVTDHCAVFTDGHVRVDDVTRSSVLPPGPGFIAAWTAFLVHADRLVRDARIAVRESVSPPGDIVCGWMFAFRAAPLANAPDFVAG